MRYGIRIGQKRGIEQRKKKVVRKNGMLRVCQRRTRV